MIIAIDLGTSRSRVVAGIPAPEMPYGLNVLYCGDMKSLGMKRGAVVNKDEVSKVLNNLLSGVDKRNTKKKQQKSIVLVNLGGQNFSSSSVTTAIDINGQKVSPLILQKIESRASAKEEGILLDENLLRMSPVGYSIDNDAYRDEALGLEANNLEAKYTCICGKKKAIATLNAAFPQRFAPAGVYTTASAKAGLLLTAEQRDKGVALVDLGSGTTSVAFFFHGALVYEVSIPIGSETITTDIATGLGISRDDAELIKCNFGMIDDNVAAKPYKVTMPNDEVIEFNGAKLNYIIKARVEEIGAYVYAAVKEAQRHGIHRDKYKDIRLALTGGGAKLKGINKIISDQTEMALTNTSRPLFENVEPDEMADYAGAIGMASLWANTHKEPEEQPTLPFADNAPDEKPAAAATAQAQPAEPTPSPAPQPRTAPQPEPTAETKQQPAAEEKKKKPGFISSVINKFSNLMDDDLNSKHE